MRIKIVLKTKKIPSCYRMMIVSLIKKALSDYDKDYYEELYLYENKKNKKSKNFAFGVYMSNFKRVEDEFLLDGITVNISSPDRKFILYLYNALLELDKYTYSNKYTLHISDVKMITSLKKIEEDYCIYETLSPMTLKDKEGNPLEVNDKKYVEVLNYMIEQTLINYRGVGLIKPIEFVDLGLKKIVVKEKITGFTQNTNKKHLYINAHAGKFLLKGDKMDLNDILHLGIGMRRNQGFGLLDTV